MGKSDSNIYSTDGVLFCTKTEILSLEIVVSRDQRGVIALLYACVSIELPPPVASLLIPIELG